MPRYLRHPVVPRSRRTTASRPSAFLQHEHHLLLMIYTAAIVLTIVPIVVAFSTLSSSSSSLIPVLVMNDTYRRRNIRTRHEHEHRQPQPLSANPLARVIHNRQWRRSCSFVLYASFRPNLADDTDEDDDDILFDNDPRDQWYSSSMTTTMIATQTALIPFGTVLATIAGIDLQFRDPTATTTSILQNTMIIPMEVWYGVLSTIPLILFAFVLDLIEEKVPALQEVSIATQRSVYNLLGGSYKPILSTVTAIILGIVAGIGEEILFRGVLQETLYQQWTNHNAFISITLSSVIFGLFHAVTPMYVLLATIASIYFGTLYLQFDTLLIPIICHSLYDIGALLYAHYTISRIPYPQLQELILGSDINDASSVTDVE
jgi:membrane protease YdiL (CAAX protease family)